MNVQIKCHKFELKYLALELPKHRTIDHDGSNRLDFHQVKPHTNPGGTGAPGQ